MGRRERRGGRATKKEEADVVKEAGERDARRQRGGGRGKRTGPGFRTGGGKDGGTGRPEFSLRHVAKTMATDLNANTSGCSPLGNNFDRRGDR